jgi:hypothetical protein
MNRMSYSVRVWIGLAQGDDEFGVEAIVDSVPPVHQLLNLGGLVERRKSEKLKLILIFILSPGACDIKLFAAVIHSQKYLIY